MIILEAAATRHMCFSHDTVSHRWEFGVPEVELGPAALSFARFRYADLLWPGRRG